MSKKKPDLKLHLTREPVMITVLSTVAVLCFLGVSWLSSLYRAQQKSLATEWFDRGAADLQQHRFQPAVNEFRTALLYSRDNYSYQLNLAEALVGQKRTEEAGAYLANLWDREPENGLVNLELARIAAQDGEPEQALRYYHNAIYATWPADHEGARRDARLELIHYLLKINQKAQAQSELIALEANLGDDSARQAQVGELFMEAGDYTNALAAYRQSLKVSRKDAAALAGAGRAAFELGQYRPAVQYLESALAVNPGDAETAGRLKIAQLVLQMDPFRRKISAAERDRIVMEAFAAAGERLQSCGAQNSGGSTQAAQQDLYGAWTKMKPQITERGLRRDPDLAEHAMELVFRIERRTSSICGSPTATDRALVLIAKLHEGN
jgi:tetratricopeptide (TPR) repeat protein